MKSIKKAVSAVLVFAVIAVTVSIGGCSKPNDGNGGIQGTDNSENNGGAIESDTNSSTTQTPDDFVYDDWRLNTPIEDIAIEQTRTYEALQLLQGDTFTLKVQLLFGMEMRRRGDDINVLVIGFSTSAIKGGNLYEFDFHERTAYYRPATDEDFQEIFELFDGFDNLIDLDGFTLREIGTKVFMHYGEQYYEEFVNENGQIMRAYYNRFNNDELYGLYTLFGGNMQEFVYHLTPNVADNAFSPPFGFEILPAPTAE
jgi:hypothetical protein